MRQDDYRLLYDYEYSSVWDADIVFGCVCDAGFTGYDCSRRCAQRLQFPDKLKPLASSLACLPSAALAVRWQLRASVHVAQFQRPSLPMNRSCISGDDPKTTGQDAEIQRITCSCTGACSGSMVLSFRGEVTAKISFNAVATRGTETVSVLTDGIGVGESVQSKLEVCGHFYCLCCC